MPDKEKYKLTRHGRKHIRKRARAEAGRSGSSNIGGKLRKTFTKAKYALERGGTGTELGKGKTYVKPKKVGYRYRKFVGQKDKTTKQTDMFDTDGTTKKGYEKNIKDQYNKRGKTAPKITYDKDWQGTKDLEKNKSDREKGQSVYAKGSRTQEVKEKKERLDNRLKKYKKEYGNKKGARKFQRARKGEMKERLKREGTFVRRK